MSIAEQIQRRQAEGRLFAIVPLAPGAGMRRMLFVGEELHEILTVEPLTLADTERVARLEAQLSHFVEGGVIDPSYMRRLRRPARNVLEIRARRPRPSIRVFGCFAETDVFIALNAALRKPLRPIGSRGWRDEIVRCGALWRQLFPAHEPLEGTSLRDFISENAYDQKHLGG